MKRLIRKQANVTNYTFESKVMFSANIGEYHDDNAPEYGVEHFNLLKETVKEDMASLGRTGLAEYIDDSNKLEKGLINSIVVDVELQGNHVVALTKVNAERELTNEEIESLKDYISGQFSDGWGEGFEQRAFAEWHDYEQVEYEDEDEEGNIDVYYEEERVSCEVYAHFWNPGLQLSLI